MAAALSPPVKVEVAPASAPMTPLPAPPKRIPGSEDSILAAIVANISVPATELEVEPMPRATPAPVAPPPPIEAKVEKKASAVDLAAKKAEEAAARKKALADKKALAAKKAAAEELAAEKKAAAEQRAIEKADPVRIWVQVAGGATESDLAKAWKQTSAKAPEAFKGRSGWTTPLRATNRVLTGPFKTEVEARAFVNKLSKEGVSAFTFTSTAGQKIAKLAK